MTENEIYSFCCGFMACALLVVYAVLSKSFRRNGGVPKARNKIPLPKE